MTKAPCLFAVAAVLLACAVGRAEEDPAKEVRSVKLDMAKLVAWEKSVAALVKLDKALLLEVNDAIANASPLPEVWAREIEKFPSYAAAIKQGFKSVREYLIVSMAFNDAWVAVDKKRRGKPADEWKDVTSPESFAFVEKNAERVRKADSAIADRLSAPSRYGAGCSAPTL